VLMYACFIGFVPMVKMLVEDCHLNCHLRTEKEGITALHWACIGGSLPAVKYLVRDHGCNVYEKNRSCSTCVDLATYFGHLSVLRFLIGECGMNVGPHALRWSVLRGHLDIVNFLTIDLGFRVSDFMRYRHLCDGKMRSHLQNHLSSSRLSEYRRKKIIALTRECQHHQHCSDSHGPTHCGTMTKFHLSISSNVQAFQNFLRQNNPLSLADLKITIPSHPSVVYVNTETLRRNSPFFDGLLEHASSFSDIQRDSSDGIDTLTLIDVQQCHQSHLVNLLKHLTYPGSEERLRFTVDTNTTTRYADILHVLQYVAFCDKIFPGTAMPQVVPQAWLNFINCLVREWNEEWLADDSEKESNFWKTSNLPLGVPAIDTEHHQLWVKAFPESIHIQFFLLVNAHRDCPHVSNDAYHRLMSIKWNPDHLYVANLRRRRIVERIFYKTNYDMRTPKEVCMRWLLPNNGFSHLLLGKLRDKVLRMVQVEGG